MLFVYVGVDDSSSKLTSVTQCSVDCKLAVLVYLQCFCTMHELCMCDCFDRDRVRNNK